MRNFRATNSSPDAEVRRALAEYQVARTRVRELRRLEPDADEPADIHEGFERLAKATIRAEQIARDTLSNAVASFAGTVPCAVIIDSPGGSSVVGLSGRPDGMIVATAADRVRVKEVLCRPEPPPEFAHQFRQVRRIKGVFIW